MSINEVRNGLFWRAAVALAALSLSAVGYIAIAGPAHASSDSCEGGGFQVLGKSADFKGSVAAPAGRFLVQGTYVRFEIDPTDFAVYNQAFTGAANPEDITGGRPTPVYASRVPDHRGLTLTSAISLEVKDERLIISRTGTGGLAMKIQAEAGADPARTAVIAFVNAEADVVRYLTTDATNDTMTAALDALTQSALLRASSAPGLPESPTARRWPPRARYWHQ